MRGPASSLSRRTTLALGGLAAGTGLAGCSLDSLKPPKQAAPTPLYDVDQPLVDDIAAKLTTAAAAAPAAFVALNRAHLRALPRPRRRPAAVRGQRWQTLERQLASQLADAACRAHSGDLARLLSSMAAAQLQLLHARGLG